MENPLVSIIVITYNSSKYALETLESAYNQTYQNIELIVSDDCSTDNTVEICKKWIEDHQSRFVRAKLITIEKNTGISANCNRGIKSSLGSIIKLIAGDDIIDINFVAKCIDFFKSDSDCGACYTNSFIINSNSEIIRKESNDQYKSGFIFDDIFFLKFWPKAPSFIYRRSALFDVGLFDENIWVEDYLLIMKIAQKFKILHINDYLAYYRIHNNNVGGSTVKLYDSQLQSIAFFSDYYGYKERKKEILINRLSILVKNNKKLALIELIKNIGQFYKFKYLKSLIICILYWPSILKIKN